MFIQQRNGVPYMMYVLVKTSTSGCEFGPILAQKISCETPSYSWSFRHYSPHYGRPSTATEYSQDICDISKDDCKCCDPSWPRRVPPNWTESTDQSLPCHSSVDTAYRGNYFRFVSPWIDHLCDLLV